MSALSIAALAAIALSIVATGCVAYIVISFKRSADLIASRVGRGRRALVVVGTTSPPRTRARTPAAAAAVPLRLRIS